MHNVYSNVVLGGASTHRATAAAPPWMIAASSIWSWLDEGAAGRRGATRVFFDVEKAPAAEIDRAAMDTRILISAMMFLISVMRYKTRFTPQSQATDELDAPSVSTLALDSCAMRPTALVNNKLSPKRPVPLAQRVEESRVD